MRTIEATASDLFNIPFLLLKYRRQIPPLVVSARLRFLWCNQLGDTADARIARVQIVLFVHHPVARLDELSGADAHAVANRPEYFSVSIELQELTILSARHPTLTVRVEIERAHEISHLHRSQELPVARIDHDSVFLAIADPDI